MSGRTIEIENDQKEVESDYAMLSPEQVTIKKLYHAYRHTKDIDTKGLFFSPTCMQICRPVPAYAATSRDGIVKYLKDAQEGNVPAKKSTPSPSRRSTSTERKDKPTQRQSQEQIRKSSSPGTKSESKTIKEDKTSSDGKTSSPTGAGGVYTIRPLHTPEHIFPANTITASVGHTPLTLKAKATKERWIGMRVDLWDKSTPQSGLLVKVQYWWRWEAVKANEELEGDKDGYGWRQCMHDIMYLGAKDGSEGEEGLEVLR